MLPSPFVRGVWRRVLSLLWPLVLWGGQPGFRDPSVPGAIGVGVGTQDHSHSVRRCKPSLRAVGVARGRPRGGCLSPLRGTSEFRHSPSPGCPLPGQAVGVRYPCAVGVGVRALGPSTVPLACMPCGDSVPPGWTGLSPGGGGPSTAARGVWCLALSLPRLLALWGGQPGFRDPCIPGVVCVGVGTQHWSHSVRPCEPSLRAVGVAEEQTWGGTVHHCEVRLSSGAASLSAARPLGGLSGPTTPVLWAPVCQCGGPPLSPWLACPAGAACRGGGGGPSPGGVAVHWCEGLPSGVRRCPSPGRPSSGAGS